MRGRQKSVIEDEGVGQRHGGQKGSKQRYRRAKGRSKGPRREQDETRQETGKTGTLDDKG